MAKSIPSVTAQHQGFQGLLRSPDQAIIHQFQFFQTHMRKPIFPRKPGFNAYRIERQSEAIIIYLLLAAPGTEPRTTAIFRFVPPPDFSRKNFGT